MTTISIWQAAQDVLDAEEQLVWAREDRDETVARYQGRGIVAEQAIRNVTRHEEAVRSRRQTLAAVVGAEQVETALEQRRNALAEMASRR